MLFAPTRATTIQDFPKGFRRGCLDASLNRFVAIRMLLPHLAASEAARSRRSKGCGCSRLSRDGDSSEAHFWFSRIVC